MVRQLVEKNNSQNLSDLTADFTTSFNSVFPNGSLTTTALGEAGVTWRVDPDISDDAAYAVSITSNYHDRFRVANNNEGVFGLPARSNTLTVQTVGPVGTPQEQVQLEYTIEPSGVEVDNYDAVLLIGGNTVASNHFRIEGNMLIIDPDGVDVSDRGELIDLTYLERNISVYALGADSSTVITLNDRYNNSGNILLKISLDHSFTTEAQVAAYLATLFNNELNEAGVTFSALGAEIIIEVVLNEAGGIIIGDNKKVSIEVLNPFSVDQGNLAINRRFDGAEDEPGTLGGVIDLSETRY